MRSNHLLSLIVSGTIAIALAVWTLTSTPGLVTLAALAGAGLWFSLCLIRFLGQGLASSTPDYTRGGGFGRIPPGPGSAQGSTIGAAGRRRPFGAGSSPSSVEAEQDESLISLVLLLAEARQPTEASISRCVSAALDVDLDPDDPHATQFVIRMPTPDNRRHQEAGIERFMVKLDIGVFAVLASSRPYLDDYQDFARREIRDKRLRCAIERHAAWISVDLMGQPGSEAEKQESYRTIGKMLASMAGPDCLGICCPELELCNEFDPGLIEMLSCGDPLRIFDDPTFAPVIEIAHDDPAMVDAVEEARRRWPEFLAALEPDNDDDRFLAKAEFSEGDHSEFMWIQVTSADTTQIEGLLVNEPHELENVHCGQTVTVPVEQLNDWIYPNSENHMVGGFTLEIIADAEDFDE